MNETVSPPAIANATLSPGGALAALVPQSLDDAFRLAKALAASGDMVPKHFQGKPEMTMAAIIRGMEIGLAPMQALSNIAVINGRASIWGDALPALMQRAGHHLDVEMQGEGDSLAAVATLARGDTGKVIERTFSVQDAKKAGLWGKAGPWQAYPARMLQMRARSLACRDGAADALMGLQVAEEMRDAPIMRDVTAPDPARPNLAQRLAAPPEAEIVLPHWADRLDFGGAFPGSKEWDEGVLAYQAGTALQDCPYDGDEAKAVDWIGGWYGAKEAAA